MSYLYSIDPIWGALTLCGLIAIIGILYATRAYKQDRKYSQEQLNKVFHRNEGGEG